jgi:hypothetical protein
VESLKAIFRGEVVELVYGIVFRLANANDGTIAWINTVEGGRDYRFWIEKERNRFGSRYKVHPRRGKPYPVITERANFDVAVGNVVLFVPPSDSQGISVFPVVNLNTYQAAVRKQVKIDSTFKPTAAPTHKRDHRWVDEPTPQRDCTHNTVAP